MIYEPTLVDALYMAPSNLALGKMCVQSSMYSGLHAGNAVNGNRSGEGTAHICHTQFDECAWWEVDLGKMAIIEDIRVWNREDEPGANTRIVSSFLL